MVYRRVRNIGIIARIDMEFSHYEPTLERVAEKVLKERAEQLPKV